MSTSLSTFLIIKRCLVALIILTILSTLIDWTVLNNRLMKELDRLRLHLWNGQFGIVDLKRVTSTSSILNYRTPVLSRLPIDSSTTVPRLTFLPALVSTTLREYNPHRNNSSSLVAVVWTTFFSKSMAKRTIEYKHNGVTFICNLTADKAASQKVDYIFFHSTDFGLKPELPNWRRPDQKWVIWTTESPYHHGLGNGDKLKLFENVFNFTASYRWDADIFTPYGYCRLREGNELLSVPPSDLNFARGKSKIVAWFVSNCQTPSRRELYAIRLKKFVNVDIFGKCGNLTCPHDERNKCANLLNSTYKFFLAFENSICEDYVTEKLFVNLNISLNIIPIVLGGANYSRILPPDSYIDVKNFTSPQKLAEYLKYLDRNDDAYNRYFRWRDKYRCVFGSSTSLMCFMMHAMRHKARQGTTIGRDWSVGVACQSPKDYYRNISDFAL